MGSTVDGGAFMNAGAQDTNDVRRVDDNAPRHLVEAVVRVFVGDGVVAPQRVVADAVVLVREHVIADLRACKNNLTHEWFVISCHNPSTLSSKSEWEKKVAMAQSTHPLCL